MILYLWINEKKLKIAINQQENDKYIQIIKGIAQIDDSNFIYENIKIKPGNNYFFRIGTEVKTPLSKIKVLRDTLMEAPLVLDSKSEEWMMSFGAIEVGVNSDIGQWEIECNSGVKIKAEKAEFRVSANLIGKGNEIYLGLKNGEVKLLGGDYEYNCIENQLLYVNDDDLVKKELSALENKSAEHISLNKNYVSSIWSGICIEQEYLLHGAEDVDAIYFKENKLWFSTKFNDGDIERVSLMSFTYNDLNFDKSIDCTGIYHGIYEIIPYGDKLWIKVDENGSGVMCDQKFNAHYSYHVYEGKESKGSFQYGRGIAQYFNDKKSFKDQIVVTYPNGKHEFLPIGVNQDVISVMRFDSNILMISKEEHNGFLFSLRDRDTGRILKSKKIIRKDQKICEIVSMCLFENNKILVLIEESSKHSILKLFIN